ncbi:MAG: lysine 2,3-aminomutase, partial [Anaerolineales bacterium]
YEEPIDYTPDQAAKPLLKRPEPGQSGVLGLLEGEDLFIKPEGFEEIHDRFGIQHRLKDGRKWVPLGIGPGKKEQ